MERFSIGGWIESSFLLARRTAATNSPMLVMAVALRLMTLDAKVVDPEFRGWLVSERLLNGVTHIRGGLLKVAAEQAIPEGTAGESTFDRESFRTHLIELAAAGGHA